MATPPADAHVHWQRSRGWTALALGLAALAAAAAVALFSQRDAPVRFTLTAGVADTTRTHVAEALIEAAQSHGADARLVTVPGAGDEVAQVDDGAIDFALISGAYHLGPHEHVREVGALYLEALHLVVKAEIADAVTANLGTLRGHSIDLGPRTSETEELARMVLAFTQLQDLKTTNLEYDELRARLDAGDQSALPDAVFQLAIVPSRLVLPLVRRGAYRLVPLPFADAMRLSALAGDVITRGSELDWQYITEATVPAFTYATRPPVPPAPLLTVGSRLLLVANESVPDATVAMVLDAALRSRFARIADPPLDPSVLRLPPRIRHHPGTVAYLQRDQPLITADSVGTMSNFLSILGALVGGALFLFQWRRQRTAARREELFGSYVMRVAAIERRVAALELAATLDLQQLIALQHEVLQVKTEALERFADGDLGGQTMLSDLLAPIDGARDHIGELLLHVRENLETKAEAEGRSEQAVWREAAKTTGDPPETR